MNRPIGAGTRPERLSSGEDVLSQLNHGGGPASPSPGGGKRYPAASGVTSAASAIARLRPACLQA